MWISVLLIRYQTLVLHIVTVQLGTRNMAGSDWTVAPNQTMLFDDVARPQYHKARLGTHSSGGAHSFAVASAARAVTEEAKQIDDAVNDVAGVG